MVLSANYVILAGSVRVCCFLSQTEWVLECQGCWRIPAALVLQCGRGCVYVCVCVCFFVGGGMREKGTDDIIILGEFGFYLNKEILFVFTNTHTHTHHHHHYHHNHHLHHLIIITICSRIITHAHVHMSLRMPVARSNVRTAWQTVWS